MIPALRPEPERDRFKRYLLPHPNDGVITAWSRATTVVKALKDETFLTDWKTRKAAVGAVKDPAVASRLAQLDYEIEANKDDWRIARPLKEEARDRVEQLLDASGANDGRNRGTEAHSLTEWADVGRLDEVYHLATDSQKNDLAAYLEVCGLAGIERPRKYVERVVLNLTVESAGTFDRLVRLRDGRLVVADVKSQQNFAFGFLDVACQLAQYAHADFMIGDDGELVRMPDELDKSVGIVMHCAVGSGQCELYEIDLEVGWEAALVAHKVRTLRSTSKKLGRIYTPPRHTEEQLLYLINHAQTEGALVGLWDNRLPGSWGDVHIEAARTRRAALTDAVAA